MVAQHAPVAHRPSGTHTAGRTSAQRVLSSKNVISGSVLSVIHRIGQTHDAARASSRRFRCSASAGGGWGVGGGTGGGGGGRGGGRGGIKSTGSAGDGSGGDDGNDDEEVESLWDKYNRYCVEYPVASKSISTAFLNFTGDAICQVFFGDGSSFDWRRAAIFTLLGGFLVGPSLHFHYMNLARLFPAPGFVPTFGKLFVDQFLFAPPFIAVFFACLLTLEGKGEDIYAKLKQDLGTAVVGNWKLWIPFQLLNFRLVPLQLQVRRGRMKRWIGREST